MATMIEQELREYLKEQFGEFNKRFDELKGDIKEIKEEVNKRFDKIDTELKEIKDDVKKLEISQVKLDGEVSTIKSENSTIKDGIKVIKGSQMSQIWSLIVLAFTSVVGLLVALVKVLVFPSAHF